MDYIPTVELVQMLKRHEGCRLYPYKDSVGVLTIGYGRNLDHRGITQEEAEILLKNDIIAHSTGILKHLPWIRGLDQVRQDVLYDMAFNLGVQGLLKFKTTLGFIYNGEYDKAADAMLTTKWARQVKGRATELAQMMRTGQYVKR